MDRFLAQRAFGQRNQKELLLHRSVFQFRYAVQYRLPELLRRNFAAEFGRRIRIESNSNLNRTSHKTRLPVRLSSMRPIRSTHCDSSPASSLSPSLRHPTTSVSLKAHHTLWRRHAENPEERTTCIGTVLWFSRSTARRVCPTVVRGPRPRTEYWH